MPRVLSIAETDPSGGAGIQADLKSITASGGYGMWVTTSLATRLGVELLQHTDATDSLEEQKNVLTSEDTHRALQWSTRWLHESIAAGALGGRCARGDCRRIAATRGLVGEPCASGWPLADYDGVHEFSACLHVR